VWHCPHLLLCAGHATISRYISRPPGPQQQTHLWLACCWMGWTYKQLHRPCSAVPATYGHVMCVLCQSAVRVSSTGTGISRNTHTRPFNGPFSGTTRVSRYQKSKPIWILLKQKTVSSSGISWAVCKSAPRSRQITTPALRHSVFYRPDALPATQPTASKH